MTGRDGPALHRPHQPVHSFQFFLGRWKQLLLQFLRSELHRDVIYILCTMNIMWYEYTKRCTGSLTTPPYLPTWKQLLKASLERKYMFHAVYEWPFHFQWNRQWLADGHHIQTNNNAMLKAVTSRYSTYWSHPEQIHQHSWVMNWKRVNSRCQVRKLRLQARCS